jgi:hypothetical protein
MSKWTSRKFAAACFLEVLFVILLCVGKLTGGEFITGTSIIWPSYFAANVGVYLTAKGTQT